MALLIIILAHRLSAENSLSFPDPGSPTFAQNNKDAKDNLIANKAFIQADVVAYVNNTYGSLVYDSGKCSRDVGYIIDALCYDILYTGTQATTRIAESYFVNGTTQVYGQETETVAAYNHLKSIVGKIVQEQSVTAQSGHAVTQTTPGTPASGTEETLLDAKIDIITAAITAGNLNSLPASVYPPIAWADAEYEVAHSNILSDKEDVITSTVQYINTTYNTTFIYDHAKCTRDIGLIIDAAKYDWQLGTNYASIVTALSYLRAPSNKVIGAQKTATIAANEYARTLAVANVGGVAGAIAGINATWELVQDTLFAGSAEGSVNAVDDEEVFNAIRQLEMNKDFIADEVVAYVDDYFSDTVTATEQVSGGSAGGTTSNRLTVTSTAWLDEGMEIKFTNTNAISSNAILFIDTKFYVKEIISATKFTVSNTVDGSEVAVDSPGSEAFAVAKAYAYNAATCKRDVKEYISAMKWDLEWAQTWKREYKVGNVEKALTFYRPGSYKTRLAARYYVNSVIGSQEEDFYYLRNGTGIRLQSMKGLQGDLGAVNAFGTQRPTAGAYCSMDPGWGPDDVRAWITSRSPYIQNCTTFGFGAVGQKIDGALHNGGNDSMVSNDFTQLISDGIGAWITNNGRAELVSVFTYYSHIGYLAENGGRIRATNGNNSYGKYGSSAEGVDPTEIPVTAVIDNATQYSATVATVNTNASELQNIEFSHAGKRIYRSRNRVLWSRIKRSYICR